MMAGRDRGPGPERLYEQAHAHRPSPLTAVPAHLEPLNDPAFFAQVTVDTESGTVVWPGGIDLAPEPLYEQAHAHPLVAA